MDALFSHRTRTIGIALLVTLILCLSFKTESLWTDEAFSAFIACHPNISSLWHMLLVGDSSDLQMWLYYCYLHTWVAIFGDKEFTLRAANIPFILIYVIVILWIRNNLFLTNWVWLAALNPFVWAYASDARPYMAVAALSTVFVLCVVASFTDPRHADSRLLPWIGLIALLIGLNLHMLVILLIPPMLILVLIYRLTSNSTFEVTQWVRPSIILAPAFLLYFLFLAWTFGRGTSYDYSQPDLLSMGSVLFRFAGLAGFAPNRHYEVAFRPYLVGMIFASAGVFVATAMTLMPAIRGRNSRTIALLAALFVAIFEALTLSFVFKEQIEVRHLTCLFAVFLFLLFSGLDFPVSINRRLQSGLAILILAVVWLVSDLRMSFLPEYRREDFRDAVAEVVRLAKAPNSEIAVVADPAAAAYYGLSMIGESPCFPLPGRCESALAVLPWPHQAVAIQATFWTSEHIAAWLQKGKGQGKNLIILISRSRHPMYEKSPWWATLGKADPIPFHGFFVYTLQR